MERTSAVSPRITLPGLPIFDGFPYISTRASPGLHHIILLPQGKPPDFLRAIAVSQAYLNALPTWLVLDYGSCCYYGEDGSATQSKGPPRGGAICFGKLRPFREFPITADLTGRNGKLKSLAEKQSGYLLGDPTKGGHRATEGEARRLAGTQEGGVPVGLVRCSHCGQWKGECLDPSPNFTNQVMTVHCRCDNRNLCAGCGGLLHEHKLNANYFKEADGQIWHVPGFCAFEHRCPEVLQ
jgi:hypothetical protein